MNLNSSNKIEKQSKCENCQNPQERPADCLHIRTRRGPSEGKIQALDLINGELYYLLKEIVGQGILGEDIHNLNFNHN